MKPRRIRILNERQRVQKQEYLTDELLEQITSSRSPESFLGMEPSVELDMAAFLNAKLAEKGLRKSKVIKAAQLNETFGYQIFSGQRKAGRDKVLALAFALGLDLKEARQLLAHANVGDLYAKNRRDAIIMFCISHGFDLIRADEELFRFGEETITDACEL